MKFKKDEYIFTGVGSYQLVFNGENIIPLNYIREDKIIHTDKKNFLVLRHVTVDLHSMTKIFRGFKNTIKQINMHHIGVVPQTNEEKFITSQIDNAKLRYIAIENECSSLSECKIVLEYDDIEFCKKIENVQK